MRRYLLASRAALPRPPGLAAGEGDAAADSALLDDDSAAVRAAELLAEQPFYRWGAYICSGAQIIQYMYILIYVWKYLCIKNCGHC